MKKTFLLLSLLWAGWQTAWAEKVTVEFYGASIPLEYDAAWAEVSSSSLREESDMVALYRSFKEKPHQQILASLKAARKKYRLNDWLHYQLMEKAAAAIAKGKSRRHKGVMVWFLLAESGFDARATYIRNDFFVNVSSRESLYETPLFKLRGKPFVNISSVYRKEKSRSEVYVVGYAPNREGRDFSFALKELPAFPAKPENRSYVFDHKGIRYRITARIDRAFVDVMADYPKFDEMSFVRVPFSETSRKTLLPLLAKEMKGMSEQEQMEFLVAFTRRGLRYGSDQKAFGKKDRPMTAEESLHYPTADCEDKVAVLYNLLRELTAFKAVVLGLPDHLTIAVALRRPIGKTFRHKGEKYTICDPTGPENTSDIGELPFANLQRGKVLGEL